VEGEKSRIERCEREKKRQSRTTLEGSGRRWQERREGEGVIRYIHTVYRIIHPSRL
jgi:hypothetical protein